jgi:hypothetical protein
MQNRLAPYRSVQILNHLSVFNLATIRNEQIRCSACLDVQPASKVFQTVARILLALADELAFAGSHGAPILFVVLLLDIDLGALLEDALDDGVLVYARRGLQGHASAI